MKALKSLLIVSTASGPSDVFEIEMAAFGAPRRNRLTPVKSTFAYGGVAAL